MNFKLLIFVFIIVSCASKKVTVDSKSYCDIFEKDINIINLSSNENELSNIELESFYKGEYKYDILYHYQIEGSSDYYLDRYFLDHDNKWLHVQIINDSLKKTGVTFNEVNLELLLNKVENKSYIQNCKACNDCKNYTFMIKNSNKTFKYISNGYFFENLDQKEVDKLSSYIDIYRMLR